MKRLIENLVAIPSLAGLGFLFFMRFKWAVLPAVPNPESGQVYAILRTSRGGREMFHYATMWTAIAFWASLAAMFGCLIFFGVVARRERKEKAKKEP